MCSQFKRSPRWRMGKGKSKYPKEYVQDRTIFGQLVMWHGVAMLPALRELSDETLDQLLHEANEINLIEPLNLVAEKRFTLPTNGKEKLTGGEVTAIMIFGLWVRWGENESRRIGLKGTPDESLAGALVHNWPEIAHALMIVDGVDHPMGVFVMDIRDVEEDGVRARYFKPFPEGFGEVSVSQRRILSEKATGGEQWEPAKIHWPDLPGKFVEIAEPFAAAIAGAIETAREWNTERK